MAVGINQARNQCVFWQADSLCCQILLTRLMGRKNGDDFLVMNDDCVMFQNQSFGYNRNGPSRFDKQIAFDSFFGTQDVPCLWAHLRWNGETDTRQVQVAIIPAISKYCASEKPVVKVFEYIEKTGNFSQI